MIEQLEPQMMILGTAGIERKINEIIDEINRLKEWAIGVGEEWSTLRVGEQTKEGKE